MQVLTVCKVGAVHSLGVLASVHVFQASTDTSASASTSASTCSCLVSWVVLLWLLLLPLLPLLLLVASSLRN